MKKTLIGLLIVLGAIALGVGGAFGVSRLLPKDSNAEVFRDRLEKRGAFGFTRQSPRGMMGGQGFYGHMQRGGSFQQFPQTGERLTIDVAQVKAEEYAQSVNENLKVSEVMEFSNNFYAVVIEPDTGKGAFELLIDPYTGQTNIEMGPAMMWNTKYGRMRYITAPSAVNTLTMAEAAAKAQDALDNRVPGAKLEEDGIDFYGYYSFDYKVDGKITGMLSVNGDDGQVSFHFWHDTFIDEKEIE
jgi:hypothetical protein